MKKNIIISLIFLFLGFLPLNKKLRNAYEPKTVIDSNGTIWTPLF